MITQKQSPTIHYAAPLLSLRMAISCSILSTVAVGTPMNNPAAHQGCATTSPFIQSHVLLVGSVTAPAAAAAASVDVVAAAVASGSISDAASSRSIASPSSDSLPDGGDSVVPSVSVEDLDDLLALLGSFFFAIIYRGGRLWSYIVLTGHGICQNSIYLKPYELKLNLKACELKLELKACELKLELKACESKLNLKACELKQNKPI